MQDRRIGAYQIVQSLGKGGMGEVLLVYDPVCERQVALKKIREDLMQYKTMQDRFLREAHVAAQLTHPSIIAIYSINQDKNGIYYTMPYVEGETLKQILRAAREHEKTGEAVSHLGVSIPTLIRIFLNVCQAIAYCHSKGVLHRDLKPENIIVGKYGEVLILDWGLADFVHHFSKEDMEEIQVQIEEDLTKPGKVVGTLAYMAPERALDEPSTKQTDIYSLGVILYQLLTLRLPFQRESIQTFRQQLKYERWTDPAEIAPYRDIPRHLADIAKKCLASSKEERYQHVEELIAELENYIEGRPEWIPSAHLRIDRKEDWEFQENVLLAKHIAITRGTDVMEWVSLMISKASFSGNTKIEAKVKLGPNNSGLGILLNVPEASERKGLEDGYCLWISSNEACCKLFRSNVEVMHVADVSLEEDMRHRVLIEKSDHHLRFFLDDVLKLSYISHTPQNGTHVGLLYRDEDFQIEDFTVFVGSQNVTVNCLAVPDAFLANKNFAKALSEYRRIGYSFPGRAEGREALFRAGITLLEEARTKKNKSEQDRLYLLTLEEFGKLRSTPGAPLEYLGKSLVYKAQGEIEEEIKCLELTLRKYPKHPLLPILIEHIVFRLHEASYHNRTEAYHFALLSLRHLPHIFSNDDNQHLIDSLKKHWEPLFFIETPVRFSNLEMQNTHIAIQLAFWLAKPITLVEIIENILPTDDEKITLISNGLFALLNLGCYEWTRDLINAVKDSQHPFQHIEIALLCQEKGIKQALNAFAAFAPKTLSYQEVLLIFYFMISAIDQGKEQLMVPFLETCFSTYAREDENTLLGPLKLWSYLAQNRWEEVEQLLNTYPIDFLNQESCPLYFPFTCWLWATKGREIAMSHFSGVSGTWNPPTPALLSYYLMGKVDLKKGWIKRAFYWEKVQLFRQLVIFYQCAESPLKTKYFKKLLKKELKRVRLLYPTT